MSAQVYKAEKKSHRHEQVVDQEYEVDGDQEYEPGSDPNYDKAGQDGGSEGVDRDYEGDYDDPDSGEVGSQEYYKRSQKCARCLT